MKLPCEVPVMTLANVTLFPQALVPLYIFEPRYRRMLADVLRAERVFCVAMQKPGSKRKSPTSVAGLGLIRVAVDHEDGTSHLILQGVARVELADVVRYKPYRVQRVRLLSPPPCNDLAVDALVLKVRELLEERVHLGMPFPFPVMPELKTVKSAAKSSAPFPGKEMLKYLHELKNPEHVVDLVSCAVLHGAEERQRILETVDVESRLRFLIRFLLAEIRQRRKTDNP